MTLGFTEPLTETKCGSLDVSQRYGPPRSVRETALPSPKLVCMCKYHLHCSYSKPDILRLVMEAIL
jgi:hypothetical protein